MQMALNNLQIEFADIDDNYREFVNKFKPKKTTDDCYTPDNVFEAVKNWCIVEYGLDAEKILRPFWPGGDYERMEYPDGCTVIDNPPFSILTQICRKYLQEGIRFFLFAPTLTNFSIGGGAPGVCHIITDSDITYENGAVVNTSFVTNLDENLIRTAPTLHAAIEREDKINRQKDKTILPKYDYPPEALTSSMCAYIAARGIELTIRKDEAVFIRALSSQRAVKKAMFGGGYLMSTAASNRKAAAEKAAAEKAAAVHWPLSSQEKAAIEFMDRKAAERGEPDE
jgi:hypothetical protein